MLLKIAQLIFTKKITIAKWQLNLFGFICICVGMLAGSYLALSKFIIPRLFATTARSITKNTDTDFSQGILSSTSVSGSGSNAVLQLSNNGGPDGTNFKRSIALTNSSGQDLSDYQLLIEEKEVGYWKMDETSGISLADISGNLNNASATGTASVNGKYGMARSFNGSSDYVSVSSVYLLPTGSSARTLSGWVKSNGNQPGAMNYFGYGSGTANQSFNLASGINNDGKVYFTGYTNDLAGNTVVADGQWHFITVTYDGSVLTLYVDGVYDSSKSMSLSTATTSFTIGRQSYPDGTIYRYVNGLIDEVRIYSRALSVTEIQSLYDTNRSPLLDTIYSQAQESGADIRFRDSNDTTNLTYWIESYTAAGQNARIWVKVPSIPSAGKNIFLYYGSSSATAPVGDISLGSSDNPAKNCFDIKAARNDAPSGYYYLRPAGTTFQAFCEMVIDGGGWTKLNSNFGPIVVNKGTAAWSGDQRDNIEGTAQGTDCGVNTTQYTILPSNIDYTKAYILLRRTTTIQQCSFVGGSTTYSGWFDSPYNGTAKSNGTCTWGDGVWAHSCCSPTNMSGLKTDWVLKTSGYNFPLLYGTQCSAYTDNGHFTMQWFVKRNANISSLTLSVGPESVILSSSGTWESPTDSNVIDLAWNGGWGDGNDGSTAFSATVANVGTNNTITFAMRTAATTSALSSASYVTLGTVNSGTTFTQTKANLDVLGLETGSNRYVQVKAALAQTSFINPQLDDFTIFYVGDNSPPETNAADLAMKQAAGGAVVSNGGWTNNLAPYFAWTAGADSQAGIKGYCLYFGTHPASESDGDPALAKGLLGTSPVSTTGTPCQFIASGTNIDFATISYRGPTWLTTSSETYYLNLKAIDEAGNVTSSAVSFSFKFDNTAPVNPIGLSAPQTYQRDLASINIFWATTGVTAAIDTISGVDGYQYKIGNSGTWYGGSHSGSQDESDLLMTGQYTLNPTYDILSTGENTFYLRTWDVAGNVTTDSVSAIIKYNNSAPSAPRNLAVTPASNTVNSFSFSWDLPQTYNGNISGLAYCYSINAEPNSNTCTFTSNTLLAADAYATLPGENVFYLVAKDEAGNINYDDYTSVGFTANTTAPGVARNIDLADVSIKATQNWKLAVSWEAPSDVGVGIAKYQLYRSLAATASCSTDFGQFNLIGTTGGTTYVDTNLTQQNYYYCIKGCDSANHCSAASSTVTGYPTGKFTEPAALVVAPQVLTQTTHRAIINWVTDRNSDSKIAFGLTSGTYFTEESSNSTPTTNHTINLTNLSPGTVYYFFAKWTDEDGNTGIADEKSFTTQPAPTIKNVSVTNIGLSSALIKFTVTGASKVKLYYGSTLSLGGAKDMATAATESSYSALLDNLSDGTKYYFKINPVDSDVFEYDELTVLDFTTLPRPKISNVQIQEVRNMAQPTLYVSWKTNTAITSVVSYYPEGDPSSQQDAINIELLAGDHHMLVRGLQAKKAYLMTVKGQDKMGNEAVSETQKYTTSSDIRPPVISDLVIEGKVNQSVGSAKASVELIVSWNTDEPSTSQVEFSQGTGETYLQKSQTDSYLTTNHLVILNDLSPSKVYHLRTVSKDGVDNIGYSHDAVTIAPKATENALDLIITNLKEVFSFLGGL